MYCMMVLISANISFTFNHSLRPIFNWSLGVNCTVHTNGKPINGKHENDEQTNFQQPFELYHLFHL